jgi:hypothetical protein
MLSTQEIILCAKMTHMTDTDRSPPPNARDLHFTAGVGASGSRLDGYSPAISNRVVTVVQLRAVALAPSALPVSAAASFDRA